MRHIIKNAASANVKQRFGNVARLMVQIVRTRPTAFWQGTSEPGLGLDGGQRGKRIQDVICRRECRMCAPAYLLAPAWQPGIR